MSDRSDASGVERRHPTLGELLAERARGASDLRLALDVGVGVLALLVSALQRFPGWHIVLAAGLCFGAFGAWGIAEREARERAASGAASGWLRIGQRVAAVLGALAGVALLLGLLALALGTWIS